MLQTPPSPTVSTTTCTFSIVQVQRLTVLISMETLLFTLLPDMVRSYWSALYCQMVPTSPGKTIQTWGRLFHWITWATVRYQHFSCNKLQFHNDGTKTQVWWTNYININLYLGVQRRRIDGMLPLHLAALYGFPDCCRKLLSNGKNSLGYASWVFIINMKTLFSLLL